MHTYERSSIINLLIIAKILIFGVIVVNIRRAEEKDIPQIEELLYQVHKVHSDKRPDLFIPGSKKYTTTMEPSDTTDKITWTKNIQQTN